ncbi:DUF6221 family protein [Streptomyces sp. NPDC051578]|uniref:DUF6221 family protein n=1 Tax=Streptomyces sp. NPDC051578 TaxID=3365662 RepID=UPI0037B5F875
MTAALLAFLRARLDEDEQIANGHQQWSASWHQDDMANEIRDENAGTVAFVPRSGDQAHIARHSPARVLAEVDAKRRLLADILRAGHEWNEEDHWYSCAAARDHEGEPVCIDESRAGGPCDCGRDEQVERRVRLLALPYASHPDFRPEWAPDQG